MRSGYEKFVNYGDKNFDSKNPKNENFANKNTDDEKTASKNVASINNENTGKNELLNEAAEKNPYSFQNYASKKDQNEDFASKNRNQDIPNKEKNFERNNPKDIIVNNFSNKTGCWLSVGFQKDKVVAKTTALLDTGSAFSLIPHQLMPYGQNSRTIPEKCR